MKSPNSDRHSNGAVTRDLSHKKGRVGPLSDLSLVLVSSRMPLTMTRLPARLRAADSRP